MTWAIRDDDYRECITWGIFFEPNWRICCEKTCIAFDEL